MATRNMAGILSFVVALSTASSAAFGSNILFILDSSNSMWGRLDGVAKIETAKASLATLIGDLPEETKVGLMVYGHRYDRNAPNACSDIELLTPVGQGRPDQIEGWLKNISPNGKTPIAGALNQTPDAFIGLETGNNNVVVISDGIETCNGDPCAVAEKLAASQNINVRVHVIGFDIKEEDRRNLECIAELGKGKYFPADSTAGFNNAVAQVVQVAQAEPEQPTATAAPEPERVFFDDFEGSELAEHWKVINPNPDAYLVEDGQLLLFSGRQSGFHDPEMTNLITLTQDMPRGDWDAIVRLSGELSSGRDQVWIGLRKDNENFLAANVRDRFDVGSPGLGGGVFLKLDKSSGGEATSAPEVTVFHGVTNEYNNFLKHLVDGQATVTLSKRGRSYFTSVAIDGVKDQSGAPVIWQTDKLTSLRSPGPLTLGVNLYEDTAGEILVFVDSVEIVKVAE